MLTPRLDRVFIYHCGDKYSDDNLDRFISKIDTTPGLGPKGNCWLWEDWLENGYGKFRLNISPGNNLRMSATHVSLETSSGKLITEGLLVRHKCDFPQCVRYDHLLEGTQQDNINDKIDRGRQATNETHGMSKINIDIAARARYLYDSCDYTQMQIENELHIDQTVVSDILKNKLWYDKSYISGNSKLGRNGTTKLTWELVGEIRRLYSIGKYTMQQLGNMFAIDVSHICAIIKNKKWYDQNYILPESQNGRNKYSNACNIL